MTLLYPWIGVWFIMLIVLAWLLPRQWQLPGISFLSAVFLTAYAPVSMAILSITTIITFFSMKYGGKRFAAVIALVAMCTAIISCFKLPETYGWFGMPDNYVIPLGLSYYVLRQIHYIFESYKNRLVPHSFVDYVSYMFFLPTIFIGPIHRFPEFIRYARRRRWDPVLTSMGCERIVYGYVKIVFIANFLVMEFLDSLFKKVPAKFVFFTEYLDAAKYGLNLYFQFSGYSDVAIGLSLIVGFKIIENFNYPFLAINISDFWSRWHASLSLWCRDYVYLPVASVTRIPQVAVICSMLVLGLWHAISPKYICWGLYHGIGIAMWQFFQKTKIAFPICSVKIQPFLSKILSNFLTMNFVIIGFIITKEPDMKSVAAVVKKCIVYVLR